MALSTPPFRILVVEDGGNVRIAVRGELDRTTLYGMARELLELDRRQTPVVVIDLADVTFVDGAAFKLLLDTGRRLRRQGRHLTIVNPPPPVRRILEVTGLIHTADVVNELLGPPPAASSAH